MSNKYKCEKCGIEYKTKNGLLTHIKEKHSLFAMIIVIIKEYAWIFTIIGVILSIIFFYYNYKPDLQIDVNNVGGADWNNLKYNFNIKNYGRSTADSVEVTLDLDYFKGQTDIIKQLPSGESYTFDFNAALPMPVTLPNPHLDYIKQILSGEKAGVGTIIINYKWLGVVKFQREYRVTIRRDEFLVHYKN